MKALKIIGIIIAILAIIALIGSFVVPTAVHVERTVEINAPKTLVHQYVSRFELTNEWSPWAKLDPNMKSEIVGTDGTVGAIYKWEGNDGVGMGAQEFVLITEDSVKSQLRFEKPYKFTADAQITLEELSTTTTKVTWSFSRVISRPFNLTGLFVDFDELIGKDYQKGLDSLKVEVEKATTAATTANYNIETVDLPETHFAYIRDTLPWSEMEAYFAKNLSPIYTSLGTDGKQPVMPGGLYFTWDEENQQTDMAAAVSYTPAGQVAGYQSITLGGKALKVDYYGDYAGSEQAHVAIMEYIDQNGLTAKDPVIELYITDPGMEPDTSKWLTTIYYLVE